jgi:hypothetical protein
MLQAQEKTPEQIDMYLRQLPDLRRYDSSFRQFWNQCVSNGLVLSTATFWDVVTELCKHHEVSHSQSQHAYAAILLLPGWDQFRFFPMLERLKKDWNDHTPKYAAFWDATDYLEKLKGRPLNWNSIQQVRDRLILTWRFFQLSRSIDLSRTYRQISRVGDKVFISTKMKGWTKARWEEVLSLPSTPSLSPLHLLQRYALLTERLALPSSPLLLQTKAPFKQLLSDRIASITRELLLDLGVPVHSWGPHSTRGAGVLMYKNLGLTSEEVCEIGKWKNSQAFSNHYLRLGAATRAAQEIERRVHTVSSGQRAEPEGSHSPPRPSEEGRSDPEGEAQGPDETCCPVAGGLFMVWFSGGVSLLLLFAGG